MPHFLFDVLSAFAIAGFFRVLSLFRFEVAATGRTELKVWRMWTVFLTYTFIFVCIFAVVTMERDIDYLVNGRAAEATVMANEMTDSGYCYSFNYSFTLDDGRVYEGRGNYSARASACKYAEGSKVAVQYMMDNPKLNRASPASPVRMMGLLLAVFIFLYVRKWGPYTKGLLEHGVETPARDIHYRKIFGVIYEVSYTYDFEGKTYQAKRWVADKAYDEGSASQAQRHALVNSKTPEATIFLLN